MHLLSNYEFYALTYRPILHEVTVYVFSWARACVCVTECACVHACLHVCLCRCVCECIYVSLRLDLISILELDIRSVFLMSSSEGIYFQTSGRLHSDYG